MNGRLTNHGLLRTVLITFAFLLAYRFLATVATTGLLSEVVAGVLVHELWFRRLKAGSSG